MSCRRSAIASGSEATFAWSHQRAKFRALHAIEVSLPTPVRRGSISRPRSASTNATSRRSDAEHALARLHPCVGEIEMQRARDVALRIVLGIRQIDDPHIGVTESFGEPCGRDEQRMVAGE